MNVKSDRIISPERDFEIVAPDGTRLDATAYHPSYKEIRGGIIVAHGLGRRFSQQYPLELSGTEDDAEKALAMELARRGFYTLIYSHRGHNGSGGVLSFRDSINDLQHVSENTMSIYRDNLFAVGFSMGGYDALHVAARRPDLYRAIVPISAPHSMREVLPDSVHWMIRKVLGNPKHELLGRYIIAGIKIGLLNGGSVFGYLRELATKPEERERLFTHIGECRLPERLHELYLDLDRSPDLEDLKTPIKTPVFLLHPEEDGLVHRKGEKDKYLDVFRRKIEIFEEEMIPGATHQCSKNGRSILEMEAQYADRIAQFFLNHINKEDPKESASLENQSKSA